MTTFLALATLLIAATLAVLLLPGFRRRSESSTSSSELSLAVLRDQLAELERDLAAGRIDEPMIARERKELERRALEEAGQRTTADGSSERLPRLYAIGLLLFIPLAAGLLYWQLGTPAAIATSQGGGGHALGPQQIQAMASKLAERLQQNPADGEGWLMLGRSYTVLGRHAEAAAAYGRATALLPPDPALLSDYADVLAMAQGRRLAGEPEKLVARALELDPRHVKALALSGTAAFERQDYRRAIGEWEKILALVPENSGVAQGMRKSIADARNRAEQGGSRASSGASVSGTVQLDARLLASGAVKPADAVFIFARAVNGGGPPVAMMRTTVAQLPLRFTLDESSAALPNAKLASGMEVVIGARVSRGGMPAARPGDFEVFSPKVQVGTADIRLVIAEPVQ